jgi:hypothetical protein
MGPRARGVFLLDRTGTDEGMNEWRSLFAGGYQTYIGIGSAVGYYYSFDRNGVYA